MDDDPESERRSRHRERGVLAPADARDRRCCASSRPSCSWRSTRSSWRPSSPSPACGSGQIADLEKQGKPGAAAARHAVEHIDCLPRRLPARHHGGEHRSGRSGRARVPALLEPLFGTFRRRRGRRHQPRGRVRHRHPAARRARRARAQESRHRPHHAAPCFGWRRLCAPSTSSRGPSSTPSTGWATWSSSPSASRPRARSATRRTPRTSCACCSSRACARASSTPTSASSAENVFLFGDLRARQVMVPRGEIDYLVARREHPRGGQARRRQPAHPAAALQRRGRARRPGRGRQLQGAASPRARGRRHRPHRAGSTHHARLRVDARRRGAARRCAGDGSTWRW